MPPVRCPPPQAPRRHLDREGPIGPAHDLRHPGLGIARCPAARRMIGDELHGPYAEGPVDDGDDEATRCASSLPLGPVTASKSRHAA